MSRQTSVNKKYDQEVFWGIFSVRITHWLHTGHRTASQAAVNPAVSDAVGQNKRVLTQLSRPKYLCFARLLS